MKNQIYIIPMFTLPSKNRNLSLKVNLKHLSSEYLYFPDSSKEPSLGNALAGNFPLELSPMLKFLQKLKYLNLNSFPRMVSRTYQCIITSFPPLTKGGTNSMSCFTGKLKWIQKSIA